MCAMFLAIVGCATNNGDRAPSRATDHTDRTELGPKRLLVPEIMRVIHGVRAWPNTVEPDYDEEDWARLIEAARVLQTAKPTLLEIALDQYVVHYDTAFEEGVDKVAEWSKPLLLLRVMFDVPETEDLSAYAPRSCMSFGGFGAMPYDQSGPTPCTLAEPLSWTPNGPVLTGQLATYNGVPYAAAEEYRFFREHFPFRDLGPVLSRPSRDAP
jgi:hypothetical protein